ncbi:hypothetical protein GC090_17690 [Pantoea sp. JZ29]|uniref:hypothetical protein n=1 Tax=Pantoea sp. JZ29 TaxID=2654192 RepID=UPI002B45C3F9|nr:hypothetical protein [Pantoea sp. JZ29]WRH22356.1 hypothetical protein GC090_17690 [Pantoea sp. JZ29]
MKKNSLNIIRKYKFNKKRNKKYSLDETLNLSTKAVTVIPFLLICFGSAQLFTFSIAHGISFTDLLKVSMLMSFGAMYLVMIITLILIASSVTLLNHSLNKVVNKELIGKSKFDFLKAHPKISLSLVSLMLGSWPFVFLIYSDSKNLWVNFLCYLLSLAIILVFYHNCLTTSFIGGSNSPKNKIISRTKVAALVLIPLFSMYAVLFFYLTFDVLIKKNNTSDYMGIIYLSLVLTIVNFLSLYIPTIEKRKEEIPTTTLMLTSISFLFLLLPGEISNYPVNKLVRSVGLGLEHRCYLKKEIDKTSIPKVLKREEGNIVELSVVINIDNIYYLSYLDDDDFKSSIRFVAADLTRVGCPDKRVPMAQNQM